jgi:glyoxylase-like metal-dependent hydrolase (beta-lactamase superfamily II)
VPALIDLLHLGSPHVIASYLLEGDEPTLVDCGPAVCVPVLEGALATRGTPLTDVRHLLLTHIHPDHAGAAGALVARHPGLQVHVHAIGAPHLVDPERLDRSARRLYGDEFDRLFGPIEAVPEANVHVLADRVLELDVVPTPGHASHHVAFFDNAGICFAGDALGCLLPPGRFLYPAAAPPEIDLEAWERSLDAIEERRPTRLLLPHFGEVSDPLGHVARVRHRLREWGALVESGLPVEDFVRHAEAELAAEAAGPDRELYRQLPDFELTYAGIRRYFDKRAASSEAGS